jgi:5-(carboxyamino)imidazole ribonucleotide synthase
MNIKTIGILGSGQLGRMIAIAAAEIGVRAHIFAPDADDSPAAEVAYRATQADYTDQEALHKFAESIDAVTSEFENVPADAMALLASYFPASPGEKALYIAQNRLREKDLAKSLGIQTPAYTAIRSADELGTALAQLSGKAILKTTEMGYDGKGQVHVSQEDSDKDALWAALKTSEAILEGFVDFKAEVSFLVWRDRNGKMGLFPPAQNLHKHGILAKSTAPAPDISANALEAGNRAVCAIAEAVDLHGILAMEAFIGANDTLIFNEIAPRPHNSFHWTIEGCVTSQFRQLVRIITGLGAGDTTVRGQYVMENLLGEDLYRLESLYADGTKSVHLYGKTEAIDGRKMGHVTYQA